MMGRERTGSRIQDVFLEALQVIGVFLVPIVLSTELNRVQAVFALQIYRFRMYLVGVINKVATSLCGRAAVVPAASSILSILKEWRIPRPAAVFSPSYKGIFSCLTESPSQMGQDALAIILCGIGKSKYFVEAGACDGVFSSNTWVLESRCEWNGLLAEPGQVWHEALTESRMCHIDTRALWKESGQKLAFRQAKLANLSTLEGFTDLDMHTASRQEGVSYEVETVSLSGLLRENGAPSYIDFLSLDTEGTEFEILRAFSFDDFSFGLVVCEHNHTGAFELIYELLTSRGYTYLRELESISVGDAWFVGSHLKPRLDELRQRRGFSLVSTS